MGDWFLGEIRLFPYNKTPSGWLECAGQTLQTSQYAALFSLLGKTYGGNGTTNFNLPDLRGRVPVGYGAIPDNTRIVPQGALNRGTAGGTETVALTATQMPAHNHTFGVDPANATGPALQNSIPSTSTRPSNAPAAAPPAPNLYGPTTPAQPLNPGTIQNTGQGAGHENRQPFLPLRYCIASSSGLYPPRN